MSGIGWHNNSGASLIVEHTAQTPGGGGTQLSLVLLETCRWEFESGPIHIPIFQEKVTHLYSRTNRPTFEPNFDQK